MTDTPGMWTDESTGLACAIRTGPLGALNGYVAVPPDHPWFEKGYSESLCGHDGCYDHSPDSLVHVHGGITYAGAGFEDLTLHGRWWFGFDTAHAGDLVPGLGTSFPGDEPRDFDYVKANVVALAAQLAAIGSGES